MKHHGSCHCGAIAFDVEGDIGPVLSCNCSICSRRGSLLWFVPREQFTLLTPPERVATYTFNKHVIRHRFCPVCGIHPYGEGTDAAGRAIAAINVRCLDGVDLEKLTVQHHDGRSA